MCAVFCNLPVPHQDDVVTLWQILEMRWWTNRIHAGFVATLQTLTEAFSELKLSDRYFSGVNSPPGSYLQLMGYKEHGPAFGGTLNSLMEDVGTHTCIDCTQRVIQEQDGSLAVNGASQAHSLALPSAQVGPSLADLASKRLKTKLHKNKIPF